MFQLRDETDSEEDEAFVRGSAEADEAEAMDESSGDEDSDGSESGSDGGSWLRVKREIVDERGHRQETLDESERKRERDL